MKNVKRNAVIGTAVVGALSVGLFIGNKTGANVDWSTQVINDVNAEFGKVGYAKKEELKNRDVSDHMKAALEPTIEAEKAELEKMFEDYYRMKLEGLSDTPEFKALEERIQTIRQSIFNRYKSEIDYIFEK